MMMYHLISRLLLTKWHMSTDGLILLWPDQACQLFVDFALLSLLIFFLDACLCPFCIRQTYSFATSHRDVCFVFALPYSGGKVHEGQQSGFWRAGLGASSTQYRGRFFIQQMMFQPSMHMQT